MAGFLCPRAGRTLPPESELPSHCLFLPASDDNVPRSEDRAAGPAREFRRRTPRPGRHIRVIRAAAALLGGEVNK